jgi:hypothetical protein
MVGPGPEGKANTYSLWLYKVQGNRVSEATLLTTCYFGIQEVLDQINNYSFDYFFMKQDIAKDDY